MKELRGGLTFEDGIDSGGVDPSQAQHTLHGPSILVVALPDRFLIARFFHVFLPAGRIHYQGPGEEAASIVAVHPPGEAMAIGDREQDATPRPPTTSTHCPGAPAGEQSLDDLGGLVTRLSEDAGEEASVRVQDQWRLVVDLVHSPEKHLRLRVLQQHERFA